MIGETVSHYEVTGELGAGGMGVVYRATDLRLNRQVALKFLPDGVAQDVEARSRFRREAQTASSLNHPNICTIYDIGEHKDQPFIVMELIRGKTLKQVINRRPLPTPTILELAAQISDALDAAHGSRIIHRDIKSSNIFVDSRGAARLMDFGLAKLIGNPQLQMPGPSGTDPTSDYHQDSFATGTGRIFGTTSYMSPEQARGDGLDARTDQFSFGVVLYEMATGRLPFSGKTVAIVFDQILNKRVESIRTLNRQAPPELERIIERALEKSPDQRYASMREMLLDIRRAQGDSGLAALPAQAPVAAAASAEPSARESACPRSPSIAVLPFVNLGGNPESDYFGDGLAEDLISALTKIEGIQVAARTSTFQYKGQTLDVRDIGQKLNVSNVLEGSFRMAGKRLRVLANLISVSDGYQLWSERFDRDLEDVFAVQDEITATIVQALEVTIGGSRGTKRQVVRRPTDDVDAYNHYLRGRFHWKKKTPEAIHKAVESFKLALEVDSEYAAAYAGLAHCYAMLGVYAVMPRTVVMPQAQAAAESALALDDTLPEAHAALGLVAAIHDFDWDAAERRFQRALELSPDYATARYWYAMFVLLPNRRFDEAIGQAEWAAQLDPVDASINAAAALVLYMNREYDRAELAIETALSLDSEHPLANITAGWIYLAQEKFTEALAAFNRCRKIRIAATGSRAWALLLSGQQQEAELLLSELEQMSKQGNSQADFEMARIFVVQGRIDRAFECLNKTFEQRGGTLFWLNVNPLFDSIRNDPRFEVLVRKLNLQ